MGRNIREGVWIRAINKAILRMVVAGKTDQEVVAELWLDGLDHDGWEPYAQLGSERIHELTAWAQSKVATEGTE